MSNDAVGMWIVVFMVLLIYLGEMAYKLIGRVKYGEHGHQDRVKR